jgi:hypothetical protein
VRTFWDRSYEVPNGKQNPMVYCFSKRLPNAKKVSVLRDFPTEFYDENSTDDGKHL